MNLSTGMSVSDKAHLHQSISDVLTTPIGSRVMRRNYGSYLSELIDQAGNASGRLRLIAAATDALMRWEPRIKLNKVTININASGRTNITIQGSYDGSESSLDVALGVAI